MKIIQKNIILILVFTAFNSFLYAQRPIEIILPDSRIPSLNMSVVTITEEKDEVSWHQMITRVPGDISSFPKSAFTKQQFPLFVSLVAGTGLLIAIDHSGWKLNKRLFDNSQTFHDLSDIGVSLGDEKYHFILAGLFTAYGLSNDNPAAIKTASNVVEAVIASGISVQILKRIFGRESPASATSNTGNWKFLPNLKDYQKDQPKYYAYPSGHITTLTASVTVVANNFPEEKWIKPVGYSLIALCGVGLVSRGMHWYSDLPLGFFIGYTFGNLISPEVNKTDKDENSSKLNYKISPLIGRDIGFAFTLNF